MVLQVFLAPKENLPKKASRVSVDSMGILVVQGFLERGVHLEFQALVDQELLERRAVKADLDFLVSQEHLVLKESQVKV